MDGIEEDPGHEAPGSSSGTVRLRTPPRMATARGAAEATVCTATGRVVMEIGGTVGRGGGGNRRRQQEPDVYFNGELIIGGEGGDVSYDVVMDGLWLAVDGTAGTMKLERIAALGGDRSIAPHGDAFINSRSTSF